MSDLYNITTDFEVPFSYHEVQGYLAGLLVCNIGEKFLPELYSFLGNQWKDNDKFEKSINKSITSLLSQIIDKDFKFSFDDEQNLSEKINALSDWVNYFVVSINLIISKKYLKNSLIMQEILFDFSEIGKLQTNYEVTDDEADMEHFNTIKAFVSDSIYNIYNKTRGIENE